MKKPQAFTVKVKFQKPKQDLFWRAVKSRRWDVIGYGGARGGGKSYAIRNVLLLRRIQFPGTSGYIFRKTYDQLEANHILPLLKEHPGIRMYYNSTKRAIVIPFPDGQVSYLYFRYLERPADVLNYQGLELEDVGVDEATQYPESVFDNLRASNRTSQTVYDSKGVRFQPIFLMSFNPGGVGHGWIKRKFVNRKFQPWEDPNDYTFIKALVYDNPKLMEADPAYVKRLESLPPQLRKAFLLGSFDVFEGQFFQEWTEQKADGTPYHVVPYYDPPEECKRFIAIDWGYFPGWFVALWFAVLPNKRLYVYREVSLQQRTIRDAALEVIKASGNDPIAYVVCDPSMWSKVPNIRTGALPPSIYEEMVDAGIPNGLLRKANNDRPNGWMLVRKYLSPAPDGLPWLQVADSCHDLIRTLPDQVYDEVDKEDMDSDGDDHWADALRYGCMTRPFRKAGAVVSNRSRAALDVIQRSAVTVGPDGRIPNPYAELITSELSEEEFDDDPIPQPRR